MLDRRGTRWFVVIAIAVAVAACARGAGVVPRGERQFQLEWQVMKDSRGALVRGQLLNPYGLSARDIHLLVEGLDATGHVRTRTTRALREIVRARERTSFDIPVPAGADRYRVTVVAFDLILPRGGR